MPWVKNAADLPAFKPNKLKGMPFSQRMQYSFDLQFDNHKDYVPQGITAGFKASYQLIMKGYVGAGIGYKASFNGNTYNGIKLNSFVDYKLQGMLFLTSGYDITSTPNAPAPSNEVTIVGQTQHWFGFDGYESALFGLKLRQGWIKKVNLEFSIQLDFLHDQQVPNTSFVVYRLGWGFVK